MSRRKNLGINLSRDGGAFKKDLGWEDNGKGGVKQPRFWLGTDETQAAKRALRLVEVWDAVCKRWNRSPEKPPRALWDFTTKTIAQAVARGDEICRLEIPETYPHPYSDPAEAIIISSRGATPYEQTRWLRWLQADFPMIRLALLDDTVEEKAEQVWAYQNDFRLPPKLVIPVEGQRLHDALDAFAAHVKATKLLDGRPTEHANGVCTQLKTMKEHQPDLSLASFDLEAIAGMIDHWRNLPLVKVGRTDQTRRCSQETAKNHIKRIREFIKWLHKAKDWKWRKPEDYEVQPARVAGNYDDEETTLNSHQVATYAIDELAKCWECATPRERLFMVLALNCGFGAAEIGSLKTGQVHLDIAHPFLTDLHGSFIGRKRKKTNVYSEWSLWNITKSAICWYKTVRPASDLPYLFLSKNGKPLTLQTEGGNRNQDIPNAWDRVVRRVRKDLPSFRKLSFNKLRKTAADAIRNMPAHKPGFGGGEIAGIFMSHGRPCKTDDLLERYSNRPFSSLFAAIRVWEEMLAPVFATVSDPFPEGDQKCNPSTSRGKIKQIQALRLQGVKVREIAERTGVPFGTVRYHLDKTAKANSGEPSGE